MDLLKVFTPTKQYPIYFQNSFNNLSQAFKDANIGNRKICIVADNNTNDLYGNEILKILENMYKEVYLFVFQAGEENKNLNTIQDMYSFFLEKHLDRKSVIVALGGGVVGDMAGFAAATYMRGIEFVQIPTSILAQVDSSVGGKVGVDFKDTKNIIGAFYQPIFVYININTAKTLPKREFNAGIAEAIKYGIIVNKNYYTYISQNKKKIIEMDEETLKKVIRCSCEFKADIVSKDEKENGLREILNFGHTIGHAVETLLGFRFVHGECVSVGMVAVMYICFKRTIISLTEFEDFKNLLKYFELPINIPMLNKEDVYKQIFLDKKTTNNVLNFVLINNIGETFRTKDVTKEEILEAIEYIIEK